MKIYTEIKEKTTQNDTVIYKNRMIDFTDVVSGHLKFEGMESVKSLI